MKWLFWNIRGVNKRYKQKEVREYIRSNKIKLVGLVETNVKEDNARRISKFLVPGWGMLANYNEARNGRIWILWDANLLTVTGLHDDPQMIHCLVRNAWLVAGDFNAILYPNDRKSCNPVSYSEIQEFGYCIQQAGLSELPWKGDYYTWTNKQPEADRVYSRLDRVFGNYEWMMTWGHWETTYDLPQISDHNPMILTLAASSWKGKIVASFWNSTNKSGSMKAIWSKLKALKAPLKALNAKEIKGITQKIDQARLELKEVQEQLANSYSDALLQKEKEIKARAKWIQLGDSNTKYFTVVMKERSQRKQIREITNGLGDRVTDPANIKREILGFYKALMGSAAKSRPAINRLYMANGPTLSQQERMDLCAEVNDLEILESLKAIGDDKAPGIDGYNAVFFKKTWSIISSQVKEAVKEFFLTAKMYKPVNYSTITLIPKVSKPTTARSIDQLPIAQ
ncbi:PREDICTED: uncharacterized protein LOC109208467 [Nicotiana attenuata]|uniref:uncharacterized protein LOC109208467 n=1 Tax=Nicotiana attenuata TaxID=49451 RepID=UPI0009050482|nr:PREDICTED: uncharacterized protein LOC109208467 [Nicotiana attenuata]